MEALVGIAILAIGMVLAFRAGTAAQAFRHATDNLRKTEASVPGLKKTASGTRWRSYGWYLFVTGFTVVVLLIAVQVRDR